MTNPHVVTWRRPKVLIALAGLMVVGIYQILTGDYVLGSIMLAAGVMLAVATIDVLQRSRIANWTTDVLLLYVLGGVVWFFLH